MWMDKKTATMKAAFVTSVGKVEIRDIPRPEPGKGQVLIRVRNAGICGSDLHLFLGTHAFRVLPAILGHEMAGEIAALGEGVEGWQLGEHVTVEPQLSCGTCAMCRQGRPNLCEKISVPGTPGWYGTFAEYFVAPVSCLYRMEKSLPFTSAVLTEPFAVAVHALRDAKPGPEDCCVILGAGTIGLLCLVAAGKIAGFSKVICTDTAPFNRELALRLGAAAAYDPLQENAEEEILRQTGGGAALTVVAAGAKDILNQASRVTRKCGEIRLVASLTRPIPYVAYDLAHKEQKLQGVWTYTSEDFAVAAQQINHGLDLHALVTQILPLDETQRGLEMLRDKTEDVAKILISL
ncbi:2,3-butanediol dehydrogenase [Ruthenibacterium sp. TH_2024_36131]